MNKLWMLAGVGALLAACGTSADGRLTLTTPNVSTEFRDQNGNFVGCDNLTTNGVTSSVQPTVKVTFTAQGYVNTARVRLIGETNSDQNSAFVADFSRDAGTLKTGNNGYFVYFKANTGQILPSGKPGSIGAQAIIVNPTVPNIKNVSVNPADRTANGTAGFRAQLTGTSDTGSGAGPLNSALVPVYSNCTFVSNSSEQL